MFIRAPRRGQVVHATVVLIAARDRSTTMLDSRQVDIAINTREVGTNLAEYAQPCDTAIRVNVQPDVCEDRIVAHVEVVVSVPRNRRPRHELDPAVVRHFNYR